MRDMQLKQPAPCCGVSALLWNRKKTRFMCPCGKLQVDLSGRPINRTFMYGKKGKAPR